MLGFKRETAGSFRFVMGHVVGNVLKDFKY